jgi:hypothetical protein
VGSWTLGYNLFADVWLGTNVVDSSVVSSDLFLILTLIQVGFQVYAGQGSFLNNVLNSTFSNPLLGAPVDSFGNTGSVSAGQESCALKSSQLMKF